MKNLLLALSLSLGTTFSLAESMSGVNEVGLIIERLDEEAIRCNLSNDLIDSSIRILLSNSRIRVVKLETLPQAYLYANVVVIEQDGVCTMVVKLAYNKYVRTEKSVGEFWQKTELLIRRKINASAGVNQSLEKLTKQFISAWLQQN